MKRMIMIWCLAIVAMSCGESTPSAEPMAAPQDTLPAKPSLAPDQLHRQVPVPGAEDLQMSIFLPSQRPAQAPLILALDAQGDGDRPVKEYQDLAAQRGWILVGSHNSQNGRPAQQNITAVSRTLDQLLAHYEVDPGRIYLAGFSGGARIAYLTAAQRQEVAGVVTCGAGMAPQPQERGFSVFGIVGDEDFNYLEMVQVHMALTTGGKPNWLEVVDGGHTWPPAETMGDAWDWLDFRAMEYGTLPVDSARLEACQKKIQAEGEPNDPRNEMQRLEKELSWLGGDIEEFRPRLQAAQRKLAYRQAVMEDRQRMEEEARLRQDFQFKLQTEGLDFWEKEARRLRKEGEQDNEDGKMTIRGVNLLSLLSYSYTNEFLAQQDLINAEKYAQIYEWIDPENSEWAVLQAKLAGRRQNADETWSHLQTAVKLGFLDADRLQSDPDFILLHSRPDFFSLVDSLAQLEAN